jgi:phosphoenolpyruvate-protein kinase (PTS system EI component)
VKGLIRALTIERCEALAERALTARTGDEIREAARQMTADAVPGG